MFLALLWACRTSTPDPWLELEALPLEPLRPLLHYDVAGGGRMARVEEAQLSLLLVQDGVQVLDPMYHGTRVAFCLDASSFDWDPTGKEGKCAEGSVELRRGFLSTGSRVVSVTVSDDKIWILDETGLLSAAAANPQEGSPWAYLHLYPVQTLTAVGYLQIEDGQPWVASDQGLWAPGATEAIALPGLVEDFIRIDGHNFVLTRQGLWIDGKTYAVSGQRLAATAEGVLGVSAQDGQLWIATPEGVEPWLSVAGATGPITRDSASGRVYVALQGGVEILDATGSLGRLQGPTPLELLATVTHELLWRSEEGLDVYLDDQSLVGPPPLHAWIAAFLERPRQEEDDVSCMGEESVSAFLSLASRQAALLRDLPLPTALGVTPFAAHRTAECGQKEKMELLFDDPRTEVGVLYHQRPEDCTGPCYRDYLASEAKELEDLGMKPCWASGMATHEDGGLDWAAAIDDAGVTRSYLFGGMSLLDDIDHEADPRGKSSWPWRASELSKVRQFSSAFSLEEDEQGPYRFYPGTNTPAFSLKGCANLFTRECLILRQGGGTTVTEEDRLLLELLLHRALAVRGEGPATWYFHLPDLGVYDYTSDCTEKDRRWSNCQAGILQDWAFDVHRRYVLNQLVEPSLPSQVR